MPTMSTMAAVKAALTTALDARSALDGVLVTYGDAGDLATMETIRLGDTTFGIQEPAALRPSKRRRFEEYTLEVTVEVIGKVTPQANEARAIALAAEVEDAVAVDPTVGAVTNLLFAYVTGMEMSTTETVSGPRTEVMIEITCKGNLL